MRGLDDRGRLTDLSNPLWYESAPPGPGDPPVPVNDLAVQTATISEVLLEWTAPAPGEGGEEVVAYILGISNDPITEDGWEQIEKVDGAPQPGAPGTAQSWLVEDLTDGTLYYFALKSRSADLQISALSNVVSVTTPIFEPLPPAPPSGLNVQWIDESQFRLEWDPVDDPDLTGYHIYIRRGLAASERLTRDPLTTTSWTSTAPTADDQVYYSVIAVNRWGLESTFTNEVSLFTETFLLSAPQPHPVSARAAFHLTLPPAPGGDIRLHAAVYSLSGRRIDVLIDEMTQAGREVELLWEGKTSTGRAAAAGFYILRIQAGNRVEGLKFLLLR
jgi:hypothetical protein